MSETNDTATIRDSKNEMPILQLHRLHHTKITGKILESTNGKLEKYIAYASHKMKTEITPGEVIEHGLKLLFERDAGFKNWLKEN